MPHIRPDPEELLRQVEAGEAYERRGRLKVFLGYAAGVGKSFRMLDEGRRRYERGQRVVIGATQIANSPEVEPLLARLPVIPMRPAGGMMVMDVAAILERHPDVCLVDGLAFDNPPGSRHEYRWQDVQELLDAGIAVLCTINLQYVTERRDEVARIRGRSVNATVPESFLRRADEITLVDAPPELSLDAAKRSAGEATAADQQEQLSQLRQIALLLAADLVDEQLESYLTRQGLSIPGGLQERILVCLTPRTHAARLIERARVIRDRFHGELYVVSVGQRDLSSDQQLALEKNLQLARDAGAEVRLLQADDPVEAILSFARQHGITEIFIGHSLSQGWRARLNTTMVDRLIEAADGIDVKLFPH